MQYPDTIAGPGSVVWNGHRYYLTRRRSGGYYYPSRKLPGYDRMLGLHQAIWQDQNGPIPSGHDVHHLDGNSLNNNPVNLEAKPKGRHQSEHMVEGYQDERHRAAVAAQLARTAQPKAAEWHASDDGHEWHQAHAEAMWTDEARALRRHERTCVECGDTFEAYTQNARFCTMRCFQRVAARDGRYKVTLICPVCDAEYLTSRHRPGSACSVPCRWEVRRRRLRAEAEVGA